MTPGQAAPGPARGTLPWQVLLGVAILAGAFLRWYQLDIQVLLDDEWHALRKLLTSDVPGIATSFGYADHSIPLTLYYRFLLLHGGLTEWVMHLPMLLAGVGLLLAAPWLLARESSPQTRALWVALLAISPLLVYHSRTARPYALTSLLTLFAILGFRRWWRSEDGSLAWGATYAATTVLSGYFHPTTLPFTLLPFVYYGATAIAGVLRQREPRRAWHGLRRLLALGTATAIPLIAALGPPLYYDWATFWSRAGLDSVTVESAYRTTLLLYGVAQPAVLAVLLLLTAYGVVRRWSRDRDEVLYFGAVALGGAVAVASPHSFVISHPLVLARYVMPALPLLLLFLAEGVSACLARLPAAPLGAIAATALAALLWWAGPMPHYLYYPNQFMGHLRFQYDYDPAHNPYVQLVPRDPVPEFYRELARKPPASLTLIEAPWRLESNFDPHPWYQEIHRQKVKIGLVTPACSVSTPPGYGEYPATATGLRLHQFAHLSNVLAGETYGADYLIMHLVPWATPPGARAEWPDVAACLPVIEAKLGVPVYRDAQIAVFDLRRERPQSSR